MRFASRAIAALLLSLCAFTAAAAIDEDDLLPVDEAFALSARAVAPDRIVVEWKIADGYYLYRHRIKAVSTTVAKLGAIALPAGKPHQDEFFGRVETYRRQLRGEVPVVAAKTDEVGIRITYQGCADLGICYPPQTRTLTVALPGPSAEAAPTQAAEPVADSSFAALGAALGKPRSAPFGSSAAQGMDAMPLPPEQAFGFEAIVGDGDTLLLRFTPAQGYYLYRDRSSFRLQGADGIGVAKPRWPKGVSHRDEHFGDVVVYFDRIDVPLPLARTAAGAAKATLVVTFQGCQTDGICYPPMTRRVALSIPAGAVGAAANSPIPVDPVDATNGTRGDKPLTSISTAPTNVSLHGADSVSASAPSPSVVNTHATETSPTPRQAEDSRLAALLAGPDRLWALLLFFGLGLGMAFTPCVYPMIPILSGLIAGRGERVGAARAFSLSLVYVLASAVVFTVAGVIAGLLGANLQAAFQTPWVLVLFALLFVALSLSMFGLYELQLPARWRGKLGTLSDGQRGGSWWGVAAMGALSALIVGPCVAPPLAAAVLYIGQTRDPVFGGAALFLLALGMGAPLLAFGVAAGRGLPTSGPWMVAIQRVFGFVFIGLAIWMLSRILPGPATLALYGLLALAFAAWLFSRAVPGLAEGRRWALRFAGAVFGLIGAAQLFGALAGGHDPLQPLSGLSGGRAEAQALPFRKIKSLADLEREVAAADAAGKPLLFDFYADWCVACKEMEKYTFTRPEVHAALSGFVLLKADVTANDATDQALMRALGIVGPPATLFYADGAEHRELRLFGFEKAAPFVQRIEQAQLRPAKPRRHSRTSPDAP